jgi:hypothetical protein
MKRRLHTYWVRPLHNVFVPVTDKEQNKIKREAFRPFPVLRSGLWVVFVTFVIFGSQAVALGLSGPADLTSSGFLRYLGPRFSLKNQISVEIGVKGGVVFTEEEAGRPAFYWGTRLFHFTHNGEDDAIRFEEWLFSAVGRRTISSFKALDGSTMTPLKAVPKKKAKLVLQGDAQKGAEYALRLCGNCHVVGDINRMKGIDSAPSFALLRGLSEWQTRLETFFILKPHGVYTQIEGVTEPFPIDRPPPIKPIIMTLEELEHIIAYVASIRPADLGKPISLQ